MYLKLLQEPRVKILPSYFNISFINQKGSKVVVDDAYPPFSLGKYAANRPIKFVIGIIGFAPPCWR